MTDCTECDSSIDLAFFGSVGQGLALNTQASKVASCSLIDPQQIYLEESKASVALAYKPDDEEEDDDDDDDLDDLDDDDDFFLDDDEDPFDDDDDDDDDDSNYSDDD